MFSSGVLINGLGRIGRVLLRLLWEYDTDLFCCGIVEPNMDIGNMVYLISHDSIYGKFNGEVRVYSENEIIITNHKRKWIIPIFSTDNYISIVNDSLPPFCIIDSSGGVDQCDKAHDAYNKGVKYIIITNWHNGADFILTYGHNEEYFNPKVHHVISTGICDTTAILPTINNINRYIEGDALIVTTLHPWLSYQTLLDAPTSHVSNDYDYRMGRSATSSIIPRTTSLEKILRSLYADCFKDIIVKSYRIPTEIVASAQIVITFRNSLFNSINEVFSSSSTNYELSRECLVSRDYIGNKTAGIIDMTTAQLNPHSLVYSVWYDNEMGYANQIVRALHDILIMQ